MGLESIEGTDFGIRSMCENALKCMKWLSTKMKLHAAWHSGRAGAHTQEKKKKKKSSAALLSQLERATFLIPFCAIFIYCPYNGPLNCCQSVTGEMCQTTPAPSSNFLRHARSCINPAALDHSRSLAKPQNNIPLWFKMEGMSSY